jgi:type I restriction enzyme M protein
MPKQKAVKKDLPQSTAQQLGSIIKSCRDIMRKDKGLNGDLDRLPMLTWIMFLKFLDDLESIRAEEAKLSGKRFRPAIEAPYRWRDWAANPQGVTGSELINFINQDEAMRPDGKRGDGLFAYLRSLHSANGDRRDVIAKVFHGTFNRMTNGYLLRDVINKINGIHFTSKDEIHTLGVLYESMLREMRDAAGDSGEFYTPRPVVKFVVSVMDPRLGEVILDPAAGTGGFLVEAFTHLQQQSKTADDFKQLHGSTLLGIEPKPLPYLLCQMNLLLHGLESPAIDPENALRFPLREIGDKDRVDIIMTNPPFGGEEERGILSNFPQDMQTAETALLFLQLIMRKLRRVDQGTSKGGRAAVVMPDGILSQEGVAARVREELVTKYNLHTVVRLPRGVFEPYTKSSTSILFFDTGVPREFTWYYEVRMRSDIKAYSTTQPFRFEELIPCTQWWTNRDESEVAWKTTHKEIGNAGYSLNFRNPRTAGAYKFRNPGEIARSTQSTLDSFLTTSKKFSSCWESLHKVIAKEGWRSVPFSQIAKQIERDEEVRVDKEYPVLAMSWYAKGLYVKHTKKGSDIKAQRIYKVCDGDFVYNRLFAWKGSFAEAGKEHEGCFVSNEFPCFLVDREYLVPGFLWAYFAQPALWELIEALSTGTTSTSRLRLKESKLSQFLIPLPPTPVQHQLAEIWTESLRLEEDFQKLTTALAGFAPAVLERTIPIDN